MAVWRFLGVVCSIVVVVLAAARKYRPRPVPKPILKCRRQPDFVAKSYFMEKEKVRSENRFRPL